MRSTSHFCSVAHADWNRGGGVGVGWTGGGAGVVASHPWRQAPVHFLVISREHLPSAAAIRGEHGPILARVFTTISEVAEDMLVAESGYRVVTNVGDDAGQTEYHLHFHCLGGRKLGPKG